MASVVLTLNSYSITLSAPLQPAFFMHSSIGLKAASGWEENTWLTDSNERSKGNSLQVSKNEASITDLYPR
jgi:hypothetical protein